MTLDHDHSRFSSGFNLGLLISLFIGLVLFSPSHSSMGKRAYFLGCVRDLAFRKRAVLLLLLFTSAIAQLSTTSLGVVVSDPAGAVIGGVQIMLTNRDAGFSRTTNSNDRGDYQLLQVPPGTYTLTASAAGFCDRPRRSSAAMVNSRSLPAIPSASSWSPSAPAPPFQTAERPRAPAHMVVHAPVCCEIFSVVGSFIGFCKSCAT